ncbi:MAG: hypothetical protein ACRDPY_40085 [Streptosporangiaceae bacterium]
MPADRPPDGNMPSNGDGPRRDHQGGGGPAEPRTRQEYYADQQRANAEEQSGAAQPATAEEQAASEKWDGDAAESRWMWGEYLRKWPAGERPPVDTSTHVPGSWHGDRGRELKPTDNVGVEAECGRIFDREKGKISPALRAVESQDPNRHLIGLEHCRKGLDRIKEKVCDKMKEFVLPAEKALSIVSDTVRYTFEYRESRYTQGVWAELGRLKNQGFELLGLKNSWSSDQYKGINSQWIDPDTGQRFEVQFHTRISFEAKEITHKAYERLRTHQADKFEQMVLEAFQSKVTAEVPVPHGATDIPDYP